jgi:hypothetical protein
MMTPDIINMDVGTDLCSALCIAARSWPPVPPRHRRAAGHRELTSSAFTFFIFETDVLADEHGLDSRLKRVNEVAIVSLN